MKYCKTCGEIIKQGHGHKTNQIYCSKECFHNSYIPDKQTILETLNKTQNITITAGLLGINRDSLHKWIKQYKIKKVYVG